MFVTEHEFQLPKGYIDAEGTLHRTGVMRLATAGDEILPMKDPRVQGLPAYLIIILLSRVVSKLGTLPEMHPGIIEGLFAEDLTYLQGLYNRINGLSPQAASGAVSAVPPYFRTGVFLRGGVLGYPLAWVYQEVAYLGCRVHWTHEELMNLDHMERRRWLEEVRRLDQER